MTYNKPAKSIDEQIELLKQRGLIIKNNSYAQYYLKTIGYYRLSGYWWPMLEENKSDHIFKANSTFENVILIYCFDKDLRLLLFSVIENIEIAFRTKLIYHLSHEISPWWFENPINFIDSAKHSASLESISREISYSKEVFIKEHHKKYNSDSRMPPAWKTIEVASLGSISKLYFNLKKSIKSKDTIAKEFGVVNSYYLPSWLQSITQIRNMIAHHSRVWNKNLPGRPRLLAKPSYPWLTIVPSVKEHHKLYIHLCCMKYLLDRIEPNNNMATQLNSLLNNYSNIDPKALGLSPKWHDEPLWRY